jgi:hypothetical protein
LGFLRMQGRRYSSLLSACSVCKDWKVSINESWSTISLTKPTQSIAEPLLWNTVVVTEGIQLHALQEQLHKSADVHGSQLGRMIRVLDIELMMGNVQDVLRMSLLRMPQLHDFKLSGDFMEKPQLMVLSGMAAASLTVLEITIQTEIDGIFPILNSFVRLHSLAIALEGDDWAHSVDAPLHIPTLQHFALNSDVQDSSMAAFIARSTLGPDCGLLLVLDQLQMDAAILLKPLFIRNTIREVEVIMEHEALAVLMPDIMKCPEVTFTSCIPPFACPNIAHTNLPDKLTIQAADDRDGLWDALTALASLPSRVEKPVTLRVNYSNYPDVDWLFGVSSHPEFFGRLLQFAIILHKRGIIVIDKYDRDVSSLMNVC